MLIMEIILIFVMKVSKSKTHFSLKYLNYFKILFVCMYLCGGSRFTHATLHMQSVHNIQKSILSLSTVYVCVCACLHMHVCAHMRMCAHMCGMTVGTHMPSYTCGLCTTFSSSLSPPTLCSWDQARAVSLVWQVFFHRSHLSSSSTEILQEKKALNFSAELILRVQVIT